MTGERPLAVQVAQVAAVAKFLQARYGAQSVRLVTQGPRSQLIGLTAKVLEKSLFLDLQTRQSLASLGELLERPASYLDVPELFSLGLYKHFDINMLEGMAK